MKVCQVCEKVFKPKPGAKGIYCSIVCMGIAYKKKGNPNWKGEGKQYNGGIDNLHIRIKEIKPRPKWCVRCKVKPAQDLANISQKYKYDPSDWEWLCRSCHMRSDGRLEWLLSRSRPEKPPVVCVWCHQVKKHKGLGLCADCYDLHRYYNSGKQEKDIKRHRQKRHK